ncbi:hypothetical protein PENTCL1PPCAC_27619 [Pristionchus entomophagus]|uniref:Ribosomal protein n=1 Tax=Pristionchus entomophagus TaxID=358040 RepID=A0AAV5UHF7_9BILA|nr:hypothetical protein PENTCL1PPCAC_27619 [Pristionchus entomophagus]
MGKGINRSIIGGREFKGSMDLPRIARQVVDGRGKGRVRLSLLHGSGLLRLLLLRVGLRAREAPGHPHLAAVAGGHHDGVVASGKTLHLLQLLRVGGGGTTHGRRSEDGRRRLRGGGVETVEKVRRDGGRRHRKRNGT